MIPTVILTAPRDTSYLGAMLWNYFDCPNIDARPTIFAEPGSVIPFPKQVTLSQNEKTLGVVDNWLQAVQVMANNDWVLFLQDDCLFVESCFVELERFMEDTKPNSIGYVSPYCSVWNLKRLNASSPSWCLSQRDLCGANAICLPRNSMAMVLADIEGFKKHVIGETRGLDTCIGKFFNQMTNYIHAPSLVRHIGDVSTYAPINRREGWHPDTRQTAYDLL